MVFAFAICVVPYLEAFMEGDRQADPIPSVRPRTGLILNPRTIGGSHAMDAGWTISIIAILIVAAIALNVGRKKKETGEADGPDGRD
jgi:hypothetical protein